MNFYFAHRSSSPIWPAMQFVSNRARPQPIAGRDFDGWNPRRPLAGESQSVTLTLKRITNLKAKGWYSGSNHVHMNYAGNLHNTPQNLFMMNAAEDADFISWQIANKDNRVLDYQHYTPGQSQHPLSTKDRIMRHKSAAVQQCRHHVFPRKIALSEKEITANGADELDAVQV